MIRPARPLLRGAVTLAALVAAGCAHAPVSSQDRADEATVGPAEPALVTGSRLPQRVEARGGLPATTSPVRIYSREDLDRTGSGPNLRVALSKLDPSF